MSARRIQAISSFVEPQQSSRISSVLILLCLGIYILVGILCAAFHAWKTVVACGVGSLLLCLPLWFSIRGHFRASHLSLMAIAVLSVTVIAWFGQGIHDLAIVAYPIVLIYAGLISDKYVLRICGVLTSLALICLALGEPLGLIFPAPVFRDPYNISYLLVATILMAITVAAVEMLSSHLKDTNDKLRRSEQKYSILFNNEVYAIRIVDLETYKIVDVNDAHSRLYGYSKEEELSGMSVLDLTAEREAAKAVITELAYKGARHIPQGMNRKKDGTLFPVELVIIPHHLNGRMVEVTFARDISDRVLAENKLRESEELIKGLLNSLPEGVFWKDTDLKFLGCNDTFAHDAGYESPAELVGKNDYQMVWSEQAEKYRKDDQEVIDSARARLNTEETHTGVDGRTRTVLTSRVPLRGSGGQVRGVVGTFMDISDRKKSEDTLMRMQRLESLGVLAGGIAHDFNNLLMAIFGFTDLAKSEVKDEVVSEYLSQAMESMEKAKGLTQQLLTFSKGGTPVKRVVSISSILRETCQFALHGSNVKVGFHIPENLWHSEVDKGQIGQVIQNLMINAIQAMPLGGTIEVKARNVSLRTGEHPSLGEGSYVVFAIQDQGVGMSKTILPRVFDPFFTTKTQGHGLGLAISHSIIARHGGAISVESEIEKGTTFTVYLPATELQSREDEKKAEIGHVGAGTILLMDDEEMVRKLLATMLESLGYTVIAKANGKDTLACFRGELERKNPFAAVILDLTVPGGFGGKEVAEEMRRVDVDVPIFVVSGYAADAIIANPQQFGVTASISKPFRKSELMEVLEKHIGKGKAAR